MQTFTKLLLAGLLFAASGAFAQDQISVQSSCAATESADKNQPPAGMIKTGYRRQLFTSPEIHSRSLYGRWLHLDVNDHYLPDRHAVRSLESSPLGKGSRFGRTDAGLDLFHDRIIRHFGDYRQQSTRRHIIRKQTGDTFQRSEGNRNRTDIRHDRLLHLASPAHCRETENLNLNRLLSGNQEPFRL